MIKIHHVKSKGDLKKYVSFPNDLYKSNPFYVPELVIDSVNMLTPSYNPAYEFCEADFFLAYDEDQIVGRIGVIINLKSNEKWGQKYARFTGFDFVDRRDVSFLLMQTARDWARKKGMEVMHGPLGFTDIDHQGMLVEGFDELDLFITIYNAPYYMDHMVALGFEKDIDWIECQLRLDEEKSERLKKISAYLEKNSAFKLLEFKRKKEIMLWADDVFDLYNTAYAPLYGTTELTDKQIKMYIKTFLGFVNPDFVKVVVDSNQKLAAFALAMPSLSKAMQKSKGKLLPFGFLHILKAIHTNDALDLYLIAVKPEYQNLGINGLMLNSVMQTAKKYGMTYAETGPMLENNFKVQSQWKFFEVRQHRRRRIWKRKV
jgi:GNAT superfamily N-acetyltransferase